MSRSNIVSALMVTAITLALFFSFQNCSPAKYEKVSSKLGANSPTSASLDFTWKYDLNWSTCTKTCGSGTQTRSVWCENNKGEQVSDSNCGVNKPETQRQCNVHTCSGQYFWVPDAWGACTAGVQNRTLQCYDGANSVYVADSFCAAITEPSKQMSCTSTTFHSYVETIPVTFNQVDIFIVIDDSASMAEEQAKLGARLGALAQDLDSSGLDWQMCYTTTDVGYYKGLPLMWSGHSSHILAKGTANLDTIFTDSLAAIGSGYSNDEQGIKAANLAMIDNVNHNCFRENAALSVLIVSDEDERSVGGEISLSSAQYKPLEYLNTPAAFVDTVNDIFKNASPAKRYNVNSIIVKDSTCEAIQDAQGTPSFIGQKYFELSTMTGGYVGDICSDNYTDNLRYFEDYVAYTTSQVQLDCTPESTNFEVMTVPTTTGLSYTLNADTIVFSPALVGGKTLRINYECKN